MAVLFVFCLFCLFVLLFYFVQCRFLLLFVSSCSVPVPSVDENSR